MKSLSSAIGGGGRWLSPSPWPADIHIQAVRRQYSPKNKLTDSSTLSACEGIELKPLAYGIRQSGQSKAKSSQTARLPAGPAY
jgi:hypothetical protein